MIDFESLGPLNQCSHVRAVRFIQKRHVREQVPKMHVKWNPKLIHFSYFLLSLLVPFSYLPQNPIFVKTPLPNGRKGPLPDKGEAKMDPLCLKKGRGTGNPFVPAGAF